MAKKGLRSWVKENWVDIANKKKDGSYPKCGRSGREKRKKAAEGGYMGSFIKLDVDGKTIGNPSLKKYYKGMV